MGMKKIFKEIATEYFLNLAKSINLQIKSDKSSNGIKPKISMLRHIIGKLLKSKHKEKYQKQPEWNDTLPTKGKTIQITKFLTRNFGGQRKQDNIFQVHKEKKAVNP